MDVVEVKIQAPVLVKEAPRESSLIESRRCLDIMVGSLNVLMRDSA